jgi:hypothetical protein
LRASAWSTRRNCAQLVSGTVEALLRAGARPEGRKELAERTGIGDEYIMDWVNRADLMRVRELHDPSRRG